MAHIFEGYLSPYDVLMLMNGPNANGDMLHLGAVLVKKKNENYMKVRLTFEEIKEDTHNGKKSKGRAQSIGSRS